MKNFLNYKKLLKSILILYIIFAQITIAFAQVDQPEIKSGAALLMDGQSGKVLFDKNMNEKMFPASITKLMTVLLAIEYGKFEEEITFSHEAVFGIEFGSSHIAVDEGEILTLDQCLYAIMLRSANECSLGVAEHIGGSVEGFVELMNKRAKELGALNTNFTNPHGLHNENHYTTAYDMGLIMKEVMKHDKFRELAKTLYYEIPPTNKQTETRKLYAQNQMIKEPSAYVYEPCLGGKTGFTNEAQNTLVTFAAKDGVELIAVSLMARGAEAYEDSIALYEYGFANFEYKKIFSPEAFTKTVAVMEGSQGVVETTLYTKDEVFASVKKDMDITKVTSVEEIPASLVAPIVKDTAVGKVDFYFDGELLGSAEVLAKEDVIKITEEEIKKATLSYKVISIAKIVGLVIVGIIAFIIILVLVLRLINEIKYRNRRKKRRKNSGRKRMK